MRESKEEHSVKKSANDDLFGFDSGPRAPQDPSAAGGPADPFGFDAPPPADPYDFEEMQDPMPKNQMRSAIEDGAAQPAEQGAAQAEAAASSAAQSEWQEDTQTAVTKCPACGANMVYDSERGKLYCEHCGTVQEIEAKNSEEIAFESLLQNSHEWAAESYSFRCENCGARGVVAKGEITQTCPYCGTSNIVEEDELPSLRPTAVVPFALGKEQAGSDVRKWARRRAFAPRRFRKSARPEKMSAVYMPAFSFDTRTESDYRAVLGKYYYTTRRVNGKTVRTRHVRYFNVSGHFAMAFDDVLIQASANIDQKSLDKLQPFNTNDSREYRPEYLSGFTANQADKSGTECWNEAKDVIRGRLQSAILRRYSYDVVSSFNINTQCYDITYKYILLPVYVGHCSWGKKLYNFFVNGINGRVTGKAPVSPVKVTALVVLCIGVLVGLYFLFRYFSG